MNRANSNLKRLHSKNASKECPSKRKFRNENEKRRRHLFSQLITSLGDVLCIPNKSSSRDQINKIDKATILRETVLYLKKHQDDLFTETKLSLPTSSSKVDRRNDIVDFAWKPASDLIDVDDWLEIAIQSMNCFFLVIKCDEYNSEIVYASKNVGSYIGYSQDALIHHSLFEFIFPSYHHQLRDYLSQDHQVLEKCDLSWKRCGSDDYEQCTINGAFRYINENTKYFMSLVTMNTLDRTLRINNDNCTEQFTTHINPLGRFTFIDTKTKQILGYTSYELIGRTYFDFVHADDLSIVVRAYKLWKENGCGTSDPYRFLSKGQQWIFMQTNSQVKLNSWTGKPESYICTTNIIPCSRHLIHKQSSLSSSPQANHSYIELSDLSPPQPTTTMATITLTNPEPKLCLPNTEITSFLSGLYDGKYREHIYEKLCGHRKNKLDEIRVRNEEIQVIDDIISFIDQYEMKNSSSLSISTHQHTRNAVQQDSLSNVLNTTCDPTLFNPVDDFALNTCPIIEPTNELAFDSIFSPASTGYCLPPLLTPLSCPLIPNDASQDIHCLTPYIQRNSPSLDT